MTTPQTDPKRTLREEIMPGLLDEGRDLARQFLATRRTAGERLSDEGPADENKPLTALKNDLSRYMEVYQHARGDLDRALELEAQLEEERSSVKGLGNQGNLALVRRELAAVTQDNQALQTALDLGQKIEQDFVALSPALASNLDERHKVESLIREIEDDNLREKLLTLLLHAVLKNRGHQDIITSDPASPASKTEGDIISQTVVSDAGEPSAEQSNAAGFMNDKGMNNSVQLNAMINDNDSVSPAEPQVETPVLNSPPEQLIVPKPNADNSENLSVSAATSSAEARAGETNLGLDQPNTPDQAAVSADSVQDAAEAVEGDQAPGAPDLDPKLAEEQSIEGEHSGATNGDEPKIEHAHAPAAGAPESASEEPAILTENVAEAPTGTDNNLNTADTEKKSSAGGIPEAEPVSQIEEAVLAPPSAQTPPPERTVGDLFKGFQSFLRGVGKPSDASAYSGLSQLGARRAETPSDEGEMAA